MNNRSLPNSYRRPCPWRPLLTISLCLAALGPLAGGARAAPAPCEKVAGFAAKACFASARADFLTASGQCVDLGSVADRKSCREAAKDGRSEQRAECREQDAARLEVCDLLGGDRYDPAFAPARFVDPMQIGVTVDPNPYFPLLPGLKRVYESTFLDEEGEEVTETITVEVTDAVKLVEGVPCLVLTDVVLENGEVIEDTDDWYGQDLDGNVWYCGEIAQNFESFEGDDPAQPELVDVGGSWKTGRDGAVPGIIMFADPQVGQAYRQEMLLGEAEDVAEVIALDSNESVPAHDCDSDCLVTRDFTPLEPGVNENKHYASGVGPILETDADGNRVELIELTLP